MSTQRCGGCGATVRIGGGLGDFWSFERGSTGGLDLELADGTELFLCFECIDRLPEDRDVTAADVEALPSEAEREAEADDD
jgi:hypothetical protein